MWAAGRSDHDVGLKQLLPAIFYARSGTAELRGQRLRMLVGSADDTGGGDAGAHETACRQFTHLACAEEKNVPFLECAENLLGEFGGGARD